MLPSTRITSATIRSPLAALKLAALALMVVFQASCGVGGPVDVVVQNASGTPYVVRVAAVDGTADFIVPPQSVVRISAARNAAEAEDVAKLFRMDCSYFTDFDLASLESGFIAIDAELNIGYERGPILAEPTPAEPIAACAGIEPGDVEP